MAKKSVKAHEVSALGMPGFNAEASLYSSPVTYRSSGGSGGTIGAVRPAYLNPRTCWYCTLDGCYAVPCKIRAHI